MNGPPGVGAGPPAFLALRDRTAKPRRRGFTHLLDKGLSVAALESLISTAGAYIDFVKLGWGTGYVSGGVPAKVSLCRQAGIHLTLGGTLLEISHRQGRVGEYARWLERLGIGYVEVSNGATAISPAEKRALIRGLSADFTVLSEVGSKRPEDEVVVSEWVAEFAGDLEAGASLVIAEGRESGTVGLYTPGGEVREGLVEAIVSAVPAERVIFEAPRKDQQAWFVRRLGADVNLGNVAPDEVLAVETLRLGLRADTIDLLPEVAPAPAASDEAFDAVEPPALLTVSCPGCGRERMTMAHDAAGVERARRCDRCGRFTVLVTTATRHGALCPCCF